MAKLKRVFTVVDVISHCSKHFYVNTRYDLVRSLHQLFNEPESASYSVQAARELSALLWRNKYVSLPAHSYMLGPGKWDVFTVVNLAGEL